jgi:uncharacterized HAD superfamily protein
MANFCIDIDNVIAQTDSVMRKVISEYTGGRVQFAYEDVKEFDYHKLNKNGDSISKDDWQAIHQMFSEPRYLLEITPTPGAIEGLHQLARKATIHIATSRLRKARRATLEWLEKYGFPDHDLHFVKHGEKHASLGSFVAAVEDHYEQAVEFAATGTTCFLLKHPWNETKPRIENVRWVDNWWGLTNELLTLV